MIKIKVKDKPEYVVSRIKGKDNTLLESIVMLDIVLKNLENDHGLDFVGIIETYSKYKKNLKEKGYVACD